LHDVGQFKAAPLIHRLNMFFGLNWEDMNVRLGEDGRMLGDLTILCLDSRKSRHECRQLLDLKPSSGYVMDCGNDAATGQVIIGGNGMKLPWELYPTLTDRRVKESDTPSCSLAEALEAQELFVNQIVATHALNILWTLFRHGGLDNQGVFINLSTCNTRPISVAPSRKNSPCSTR